MPYARVNSIETYYEDEGTGTPVLFIHGGFGGAESTLYPKPSVFKDVLPPERLRTITYERRGAGRSEYASRHYRLGDLAADVKALLDHLEVQAAIVVGDSLGGMVALTLALAYPERVVSLLLVETGKGIVQPPRHLKAALLVSRFLPLRPLFPFLKRRALRPPFHDPLGPLTADEFAERRRRHAEYVARVQSLPDDEIFRYAVGLLRNYDAFAGIDLGPKLSRLTMPVDIMHGTADLVVAFEAGRTLHQHLPGSRFYELAGLGHGLFYYPEARALSRRIIEEHAERLEGGCERLRLTNASHCPESH